MWFDCNGNDPEHSLEKEEESAGYQPARQCLCPRVRGEHRLRHAAVLIPLRSGATSIISFIKSLHRGTYP